MADITTNATVFTYLGIELPTDAQKSKMTIVRRGVEGAVKNFCNWQITEDDFVVTMPKPGVIYANNVWTAQLSNIDSVMNRTRMQLPVPFVSAVEACYENSSARGGENSEDFTSDYLLVADQDYFLDKEGTTGTGKSFSMSGGLIRVNNNWSSVPMTIRVEFKAGFDNDDLDNGIASSLKSFIVQKCADVFMYQTRKQSLMYASGSGGYLKRERLGDYDVTFADIFEGGASGPNGTGVGLTDDEESFLIESGFAFMAVGV